MLDKGQIEGWYEKGQQPTFIPKDINYFHGNSVMSFLTGHPEKMYVLDYEDEKEKEIDRQIERDLLDKADQENE